MSDIHLGMHLHADDTFTTNVQQYPNKPLVLASVHIDLAHITTSETDSFRALAAALLKAADEAERLYAQTYGVPA